MTTPWLDDEQQRVWRRWLALTAELPAALNRELQADGELSLPDFEVLVRLTDVADGRLRVSDLASALAWERSRLSHHLKRMEARGLICRDDCAEDGRGSFVAVTEQGRRAIEHVAPAHVATVRRLVFDAVDPADLAAFGRVVDTVLDRLSRS